MVALNHGIGLNIMRIFYHWILRTVEVISIVGISLVVIFTAYEVTMREIFSKPTIWTNEITSYLLVWLGLLGIVYAFEKKSHVSVDLVYRHLNPRGKQFADLTTHFLMFLFAILICIYGYKYSWLAYSRDWRHFGMLDVPMIYTRIAIPIAGILMVLQIGITTFDNLRKLKAKNNTSNLTANS